jgi:hypothetical protein
MQNSGEAQLQEPAMKSDFSPNAEKPLRRMIESIQRASVGEWSQSSPKPKACDAKGKKSDRGEC